MLFESNIELENDNRMLYYLTYMKMNREKALEILNTLIESKLYWYDTEYLLSKFDGDSSNQSKINNKIKIMGEIKEYLQTNLK